LKWRRGKTGVPILAGVLAAIECAVRQRFTAGDHDVFVGEMVGARVAAGAPLIHLAGRYRRLDVSR
jgi:flavin reductase (DIM6/NTAB) family NADH-FMN oxidoreductase RutF